LQQRLAVGLARIPWAHSIFDRLHVTAYLLRSRTVGAGTQLLGACFFFLSSRFLALIRVLGFLGITINTIDIIIDIINRDCDE
jgi:hypothetical protein